MSHHALTPLQEREVARRYVQGESLIALAASYGCSVTPIRQALKKLGVPSRATGPRPPGYVPPRAKAKAARA